MLGRIALVDEDGARTEVDVNPQTPLDEIFRLYCERNSVERHYTRFRYLGKRLWGRETPETLGMNLDGNEAIISVDDISTYPSKHPLLTGWAVGKFHSTPNSANKKGHHRSVDTVGLQQREALAWVHLLQHFRQDVYLGFSFWRKILYHQSSFNVSRSAALYLVPPRVGNFEVMTTTCRLKGFFGLLFPGVLSDRECLQKLTCRSHADLSASIRAVPRTSLETASPENAYYNELHDAPLKSVTTLFQTAVSTCQVDIANVFIQTLKITEEEVREWLGGVAPMAIATATDSLQMVKLILPFYDDVCRWRLLHDPLKKWHSSEELLHFLIDEGAKQSSGGLQRGGGPGPTSATEVLVAATRNMMDEDEECRDEGRERRVVKHLLQVGAQADQVSLHDVKCGAEVLQLLIDNGADVNVRRSGRTPLHAQSKGYWFEVVKVLLENGADPKALTSKENHTALHIAITNGCIPMAQVLWQHGGGSELVEPDGTNALHWAMQRDYYSYHSSGRLLRKWLAAEATPEMLNTRDTQGNTPLLSPRDPQAPIPADVFQTLIARGADVNVSNDTGRTPLHGNRDLLCCRVLLDAGADGDAVDRRGTPALHAIMRQGPPPRRIESDFLFYTNVHAKDEQGRSLLYRFANGDYHRGSDSRTQRIISYLMKAGASLDEVLE